MKNKIITQTTNIKKKLFSNKKRITLSTLTFLLIGGIILFGANYFAKGATYGWLQSTWSGGADTNAVADHTNNQFNWTKYFSKEGDVNVDGSGNITLSGSTASWNETDDADFNAGTPTDMYVDGGSVQLKKPDGASCSLAVECYGGFCTANVCANS